LGARSAAAWADSALVSAAQGENVAGMSSASSPDRGPLLAAGVLGLLAVGLGAMGAHGLKAVLMERGMTQAWETAARYHAIHAVALLGLAAWARADGQTKVGAITWSWVAGTVLFSGSLYGLALGGPRWLGPVTPLGGLAFMLGWLLVALQAWRRR
jgi:uncharacterized membrane protein YgdD (TMEM256/DUF423 family)